MRLFISVASFSVTFGGIASIASRETPEDLPLVVDIRADVPQWGPCDMRRITHFAEGVDPRVVRVTFERESGCNPLALGSMGEIGLGQIRYEVWGKSLREAGIIRSKEDLWEINTNIRATAWIFTQLTGNTKEKFRKYNGAGPKARAYATQQMKRLNTL